ncbi:MAG: hypothetical protein ABL931_20970 [Usitatibacteraceae bacterium]
MTTIFVHRYPQPEMKLELDTDMEVFPAPSLGDKVYQWAKLQAAGEAMTVYGFYLFEDRLLSHTRSGDGPAYIRLVRRIR